MLNKKEFKDWIITNYDIGNKFSEEMLDNILSYAEGMEEDEQYLFLCTMIPQVPERIIRDVAY